MVPDEQSRVRFLETVETHLGRDAAEYLMTVLPPNDWSKLATKEDLELLATKRDLELMATKEDLELMATKEDLAALETRVDAALLDIRHEFANLATRDELAGLRDEMKFELHSEIRELRTEFLVELYKNMNSQLRWFVTTVFAMFVVFTALQGWLNATVGG